MAGKSLGTLTLDLIARTGGFSSGMDKAERSSQKWRKQVESDAKLVGVALGSVALAAAAAATSVGVAGFNLVKNTSKQITETDRWAKSLKMSTQNLLAWQFAAEKAGVSGDQMADIFKDIGDKIGDAVLNKSGEAVDALNALGLSAEKLSKATPDQQLLAIGDALGKIGTNAEKTTILESLGNDLSKLLPLFDNNNEKLQQFITLAKDYGVAPDPKSIDDLVKVNSLFEDMEAQAKGLKMEIASGLAKVNLDPLKDALGDVKKTLTDPKVLQGLSDLVTGVAQLAGFMIRTAAEAGKLVSLATKFSSRVGANIINGVDVSGYDSTSAIDARLMELGQQVASYNAPGNEVARQYGSASGIEGIQKEIAALQERKKVLIDSASAAKEVQDIINKSSEYGLGKDENNGKTSPDTAAKKLENSFKSMETSFLRQKALIDITGKKTVEVTELQKLQFDMAEGKLSGLNEKQKERLSQLASEVDQLNALKKANEENLKVAEFVATLQAQNANAAASMNAEIAGAGLGDKERERLRERLDIEREFLDQQSDLQKRRQSDEISQNVYDRETAALSTALQKRLGLLDDHYKKRDELDTNWIAGAKNGLANWVDTSSDYYTQVSDLVGNTLDGLVDNMAAALNGSKQDWADWGMSVLNELQKVLLRAIMVNTLKSAGDSGWFGSLGGMFGSSVAGAASAGGATPSGAYTGAASQLKFAKGGVMDSPDLSRFRNGVVNSPTMFAFAKGAGLMGEAGPEAIMPLTRTADGTLGIRAVDDAVSKVNPDGRTPSDVTVRQTNHFNINGNGDAALKQAMEEAAAKGTREGAKQGYQQMLQDFQSRGQGRRLLGV
ncbi:TPA: phage tail tape measure protein [Citrobacter freundii]|uniref:Phage tail tape measure protein n=1 Tax=Citrobacter amalonaticus TaxID=35703 RepID=A0A9C7V125_CITAM|nr:phage tail tape measure protein [Citrobacter farmeri]MDU1222791.1 phage tail tape measure protein [Citrobacter freundii]HCD1254064.1 phage tail tape measure protein [Citrobacter amalonaticus]HED1285891.1 phage tail tape measure protein [Citrobacter freundii]HED2734664.1 phage tail tape measure protein [Citrobacter farmeri]